MTAQDDSSSDFNLEMARDGNFLLSSLAYWFGKTILTELTGDISLTPFIHSTVFLLSDLFWQNKNTQTLLGDGFYAILL